MKLYHGSNQIIFDEELLNGNELHICRFEDYSKEWANFVFTNRDISNKSGHSYDIVYGPIANDRVGRQITNFKESYISFEESLNRLKYMKGITFQYAFCTEKAISKLQVI